MSVGEIVEDKVAQETHPDDARGVRVRSALAEYTASESWISIRFRCLARAHRQALLSLFVKRTGNPMPCRYPANRDLPGLVTAIGRAGGRDDPRKGLKGKMSRLRIGVTLPGE